MTASTREGEYVSDCELMRETKKERERERERGKERGYPREN